MKTAITGIIVKRGKWAEGNHVFDRCPDCGRIRLYWQCWNEGCENTHKTLTMQYSGVAGTGKAPINLSINGVKVTKEDIGGYDFDRIIIDEYAKRKDFNL